MLLLIVNILINKKCKLKLELENHQITPSAIIRWSMSPSTSGIESSCNLRFRGCTRRWTVSESGRARNLHCRGDSRLAAWKERSRRRKLRCRGRHLPTVICQDRKWLMQMYSNASKLVRSMYTLSALLSGVWHWVRSSV